ncbi:hypothetical protein MMC16_002328 [Acarospora aff. strigata]|nr:hypothetical protein [Acarospora aff. strigata]
MGAGRGGVGVGIGRGRSTELSIGSISITTDHHGGGAEVVSTNSSVSTGRIVGASAKPAGSRGIAGTTTTNTTMVLGSMADGVHAPKMQVRGNGPDPGVRIDEGIHGVAAVAGLRVSTDQDTMSVIRGDRR